MIPTRSASASASSRYWVVRKTVTPSSAESRATSSQSAVRLCTSRPVVGSSRNRTRGLVDERQRQVEAAAHAARVAADLAVGRLGEADPRDQLVAATARVGLAGCRASRPAGACARARSGTGRAPPPAGRRRSRRERRGPRLTMSWPATRAVPDGGREQRGQHVHGGRLAGAVRAEEAVDLARGDLRSIPSTARGPFLNSRTSPSTSIPLSVDSHPLTFPYLVEAFNYRGKEYHQPSMGVATHSEARRWRARHGP